MATISTWTTVLPITNMTISNAVSVTVLLAQIRFRVQKAAV
jgi:hypothetical protein